MAVMELSGLLPFRSLRLFPGRGSFGLTVALDVAVIGSVIGVALAGALIDLLRRSGAFLIRSMLPAAVTLTPLRECDMLAPAAG